MRIPLPRENTSGQERRRTTEEDGMTRRAFLATGASLAALMLIGALPAAAQTPVRGGTLTIGQSQDMKTLDPVRSQDLSEREVMYLIYNTLVRLDTDFSVKPELAASWQTEEEGL